jgi:hypothetical protein
MYLYAKPNGMSSFLQFFGQNKVKLHISKKSNGWNEDLSPRNWLWLFSTLSFTGKLSMIIDFVLQKKTTNLVPRAININRG